MGSSTLSEPVSALTPLVSADWRLPGDPLFTRLVAQGVADDLDTALAELNEFT